MQRTTKQTIEDIKTAADLAIDSIDRFSKRAIADLEERNVDRARKAGLPGVDEALVKMKLPEGLVEGLAENEHLHSETRARFQRALSSYREERICGWEGCTQEMNHHGKHDPAAEAADEAYIAMRARGVTVDLAKVAALASALDCKNPHHLPGCDGTRDRCACTLPECVICKEQAREEYIAAATGGTKPGFRHKICVNPDPIRCDNDYHPPECNSIGLSCKQHKVPITRCPKLDHSEYGPCDRSGGHKGICASRKHFKASFFEENNPFFEENMSPVKVSVVKPKPKGRGFDDPPDIRRANRQTCVECQHLYFPTTDKGSTLTHCAVCVIGNEAERRAEQGAALATHMASPAGEETRQALDEALERERIGAQMREYASGPRDRPEETAENCKWEGCSKEVANTKVDFCDQHVDVCVNNKTICCAVRLCEARDLESRGQFICEEHRKEQDDNTYTRCKVCGTQIYVGNCCSEACTKVWLAEIAKVHREKSKGRSHCRKCGAAHGMKSDFCPDCFGAKDLMV